jgi:amino acid transporter
LASSKEEEDEACHEFFSPSPSPDVPSDIVIEHSLNYRYFPRLCITAELMKTFVVYPREKKPTFSLLFLGYIIIITAALLYYYYNYVLYIRSEI